MDPKTNKSAQALLKATPSKKEIYATEDGNLFFNLHDARDHNRKLKGEVITITRDKGKEDLVKDPSAGSKK